jgi:hypothetical protein
MSNKPILSPENVPTIAAVAAILSLMALAYGYYVHREVLRVAVASGPLDINAGKRDAALDQRLADVEKRLQALEAPPAPAALAEAPAAPAEAPAAPPP